MVLALTSDKGGVGKSTLGIGIASEWMSRSLKVLLLDADGDTQTATEASRAARAKGLLAPDVIPVGTNMRREVLRAREVYDHLIIDCPGHSGGLQQAALACADIGLVPVSSSAYDVRPTDKVGLTFSRIRQTNPTLRGAFVLTRLQPTAVIGRMGHERMKGSGLPVFKAVTHHRNAWIESGDVGQGVAQYAPTSRAADELRAVVAELERFFKRGAR